MKKLHSLIRLWKCKKGFTLMEALVTIMVFSVLMLAVTTMISTSLRLTAIYFQRGATVQDNANNAILGRIADDDDNATETDAKIIISVIGTEISVDIDVTILQNDNFIAFRPIE